MRAPKGREEGIIVIPPLYSDGIPSPLPLQSKCDERSGVRGDILAFLTGAPWEPSETFLSPLKLGVFPPLLSSSLGGGP